MKRFVTEHIGFVWVVLWTVLMAAAGYGLAKGGSDPCPGHVISACSSGTKAVLVFFELVVLLLWTYGAKACLHWWRPDRW